MPPPMIPPKLPPLEFIAAEALYSSIIFLICFLIYHRLREVYKLSDYRGFHFFSNTFLFLGLAYFLRFVVLLLSASGVMFEEISLEGLRGIMAFSMPFSPTQDQLPSFTQFTAFSGGGWRGFRARL